LVVPATVLLVLAGIILHVTAEPQARTAVPAARLRALGMSRHQIRTSLIGQHVIVLVPLGVAGTAVGALATWIVAPLLIRSDTGAVPVPAVAPVWPWATEALLSGGLVIGCLVAVGAAVRLQVRRSDAAQLRDAP
jgi:ABC-type antimicrobial peptide transport system permease subunit